MSEYVPAKDQAAAMRKVLKRDFPGVKFSVRIGAGRGSINVGYVDGPKPADVERVLAGFSGGGFDGMTDCAYSKSSWFCEDHGARPAEVYGSDNGLNGPRQSRCCAKSRIVHFLADYVFVERKLSPDFQQVCEDWVAARYGVPFDPENYQVGNHGMRAEARARSFQVAVPLGGEVEAARAQLAGASNLPRNVRGDLLAANAAARVLVVVPD